MRVANDFPTHSKTVYNNRGALIDKLISCLSCFQASLLKLLTEVVLTILNGMQSKEGGPENFGSSYLVNIAALFC